MYLNDGVEHQVQVDADTVEGFKAKDESAFPQTENLSACTRCASRRPCGREAAAAKVA